jgi:hypothetical protein
MRFTHDNENWERVPNSTEAANGILTQIPGIALFSAISQAAAGSARRVQGETA